MKAHRARLVAEVAALLLFALPVARAGDAEDISFPFGNIRIHGLLYKPAGNGPFPTVIYYGNFPGSPSDPSSNPASASFPVEPVFSRPLPTLTLSCGKSHGFGEMTWWARIRRSE
jgi:hypothetical protein